MIYHPERLLGVHPTLWLAMGYFGYASKYDWKIVSGTRTPEEAAANYAIGRTTDIGSPVITDAPPGSSPHEYGLALDIQPTLDKGATVVQDGNHPAYAEKTALLKAFPSLREISISSGKDSAHVELSDWVNMKAWKETYAGVAAVIVGVVALSLYVAR